MVISCNSQLGLRFKDKAQKVAFMEIFQKMLETKIDLNKKEAERLRIIIENLENDPSSKDDYTDEYNEIIKNERIPCFIDETNAKDKVSKILPENHFQDIVLNDKCSYYFICDSVYKAAELIKVSSGFTGRTLKDINFGSYVYLMGKNRMIKFCVFNGGIKGFYYDDKENKVFEWGIEMEDGGYFYEGGFDNEFTTIMRVLTFVELGDIEILELLGGRNNGGKKNEDKITNTSNNTVYVVDSSWNKIIIRTTGFAVRGHFRLQPCGHNMADRKLIWIDAFEKIGYKRRPKAEIVRD